MPVISVWFCSCVSSNLEQQDILSQASTFRALQNGVYDGALSCRELKLFGDFGVGTFEALDGEMIIEDGNIYKVRADGTVETADDTEKTPFAAATFFRPEQKLRVPENLTYTQFCRTLDKLLGSPNLFYAVKITGTFRKMKTGSMQRQRKPYPSLKAAALHQKTFTFENIRGTVTGFRFPEYMRGVDPKGYYLSFLSSDKTGGGRIIDFVTGDIIVEIDTKPQFFLILPESEAFGKSALSERRN